MKFEFIKNKFFLTAVLVLAVFFLYASVTLAPREYMPSKYSEIEEIKYLNIGGENLEIELVVNEKSRARGLSGRESLGERAGMLFVFESEDKHSFWMKDMNFSIDIIWMNEDLEVVHMEKSVSPDTYPQIFIPKENAKYVLEVLAGFSEKVNLKIGQKAQFLSS